MQSAISAALERRWTCKVQQPADDRQIEIDAMG